MASIASFICGVLELVLVALGRALSILRANGAGVLTKFLDAVTGRCGLDHERYLIDAHGMLPYSDLIEYVGPIRYEGHGIRTRDREAVKIHTVYHAVKTFNISHESHSATSGCADLVTIDRNGEVLPGIVFQNVRVCRGILCDIVHGHHYPLIYIRDLYTKVYCVDTRDCLIN
jgi:hypothetical protein